MTDGEIAIWSALPEDLPLHFVIRHRVFVNEQGILLLTDVDRWDDHPQVVHVLAARGQSCAGTVRLYPIDSHGRWRGDRLAVLKPHRASLVGAQLVRFAIATAAARGGRTMEASVQLPNVGFFERLGWTREGAVCSYLGVAHQSMLFDLSKPPAPSCRGRPDSVTLDAPIESVGEEILCPA